VPEKVRWRPSNLMLRWVTAGILIPPIIWACYTGGPLYVGIIILFNILGINEFYSFISQKGAVPHRLLGTLAAAVLPLIAYVGDAFLATSFMTAVLLTVMILQLAKNEIRETISSVSATFFGVFYVGWLLSHGVSVRFIYYDLERRYGPQVAGTISPEIGFFFMMLCLVAAVLCDAGAYFVGRRYGRHKLAPAISPNKTVEGAFGGLVVGATGAVLTKLVFDWLVPGQLSKDFTLVAAILFGVVIAAVAVLGDLIESVLKRDADLKDAGSILPGVGGVLDRIDSALLAIPVMYYLLLAYYWVRFVW
jgi:phosphatidate cytidylyltransferase